MATADVAIQPVSARLVRDLASLIAIPSVNPFDQAPTDGHSEEDVADFLLSRLQELGFETERREVAHRRPNVWGKLRGKGDGPSVMLVAHLDTVGVDGYQAPFEPVVRNGRVHGRGACDMKAAIACFLEVAELLRAHGIELAGDLIIAGLCDEEHVQIGSADMGRNGPKADYGIVGEPTELAICPSHKGQLGVTFKTFGKAVHSSGPENGVNAVEHMGQVIAAFSTYNAELQLEAPHPLCGNGRFSMNVVNGGQIVSAVPDMCTLEVDRRFLPGENTEEIIAGYNARLAELRKSHPDLAYEVSEPFLQVDPLDISVDSPLVVEMKVAVSNVLASEAQIRAFPGGTDGPNLDFPCVICGPGSLKQAHSVDEYVEIDQMEKATAIYLNAILALTDTAW
ncbi:M20 family metallopeptidase [Roseibium sp. SCP14]|uniref:M20 family metallopeptidase n=1 Tax=Roseibium sp. SCP14 TaxID=3141375 RepID=UPI003335FFB4